MPFVRRTLCCAVSAVFCLASPSAHAESPPERPAEQAPSPAEPTSAAAGAETSAAASPSASKAVISATRFNTTIDTPTNVTIVTAEEIRNSNALDIADALLQLGGVRVQTGAGTRVDLAGFGEAGALNTLVLVNGRRLNDVDLSGANLSMIALQSIERIEIVRGASTVLYGDNAVGGVINIVTKTGFEGPAASASARGGSFSTLELGAQGRWSGDRIAVVADGNRLISDGYRDHGASEVSRFGSELTAHSGEATWGVRALAYRDDNELPGALTEDQYRQDPEQAGDYLMDTEESHSSLDLFFNGPAIAMELAWRDKNQRSASISDDRTDADLTTLSLTPRFRTTDETNTRIVGADLYRSTLQTRSHNPTYGSDVRSDVTRNSVALYASDTHALNSAVALGFGVRAQNVGIDLDSRNVAAATTGSDDQNDLEYGWDLSLQFRYSGGARSHVRVARSFRFAVLDEMWSYFTGGISLLDPQIGRHVEVGGQFPFSEHTQFDASVYRITLTDEIGYDPLLGENTNLDPTERHGADLSLKIKPLEAWSLRLMHSYRVAKFRSGPLKDMHIPDVPHHMYTLGNVIDAGVAGLFNLDAQFVGKRYFGSDYTNSGKQMKSYTRINAGWSHDFPHGNVRVGVNNVTDEKTADAGYYYEDYVTGEPVYNYYPLPGRSYSVQVRVEL